MKVVISFLLTVLIESSYAQSVPELFKTFNPVYPAGQKLLSFNEKADLLKKMSISNRISFSEFEKLANRENKKLLEELKKVDSLLTVSKDSPSPIWEGSLLKAYSTDTSSIGEIVILQYPNEFSMDGFSTEFNLPVDSFPKIKMLKKIGRLIESKNMDAVLRNEIDFFPNPVNTENYASHLLELIRSTLTSYEQKLKFPYVSYVVYENKRNISPLSKIINFRIAFLKRCYANI